MAATQDLGRVTIEPALERLVESFDIQSAELQALQAVRVRDILLVASLYDSYTLSGRQRLSELIVSEYQNLALSAPPQITRVASRAKALEMLGHKRFDLVITMAQAADMTAGEFARAVKERFPGLPVFMVAYNMQEVRAQEDGSADAPGIDRAFVWRGDVSLFLAIIKLAEDQLNVEHDTRLGDVRSLILVEDNVSFYSSYLPMIFSELVKQTESLISDEVNLGRRLLRRRLRPKVLLASTFEEGWALYEQYQKTALCVISDVRFPHGGTEDPGAGLSLLERIRTRDEDIPLILQSSDERFAAGAEALGAWFLHKHSPTLLNDFRDFMLEHLGFGDFVFRLADGTEVARASDVDGMLEVLESVPAEALLFHASRNHFSNWLMARTEFRLATALRKLRVSDFDTVDDMRDFLFRTVTVMREEKLRGQVADFDARRFDAATEFVRIGGGSLGGKGRGLAFVHELVSRGRLEQHFDRVRLFVPHSAVIGTDVFDRYLEENDLLEFALREEDDRSILRRFHGASLPEEVLEDLVTFLGRIRYPLAVRSSSLLEDARYLPAAGIYPTHMLRNDGELTLRLEELQSAVKHIYASTFFQSAKAYLASTPSRVEEEKMAIVIQQVVGQRHGDVVYPEVSGVARSYNFYPIRDMRPEEGIAAVALGLGKTVVEGGRALRFSPAHPQWLPQFSTPEDALENAQRMFWALDMSRPANLQEPGSDDTLVELDLRAAEGHGTLWTVASVYSPDNHAVYDGLSRPGVRLVTMAPILKHGLFPLAEVIRLLLTLGTLGMSGPVEIEFAVNLQPDGGGPGEFALLQIRPLVLHDFVTQVDLQAVREADVFIRSPRVLGSGRNAEIRDVVTVRMDVFDRKDTVEIAEDVGRMNVKLQRQGKPYLLIGPGRWGTADRWMGIPVSWYQIAGAQAIAECDMDGLVVEPSQGTHFFHNITSQGIAYFTVSQHDGATIDWDWLTALRPKEESTWVHHFELSAPLELLIDGQKGEGVILKQVRPPSDAPSAAARP